MIKKYRIFILIILAYITVLSFYPALSAGFINLDDNAMLTYNRYVRSLSADNIISVFSNYHYRLYHPLVTISYAIEYHFFKFDPFIYHFTNIILHLLNTFLVFFIFKKLTNLLSFHISFSYCLPFIPRMRKPWHGFLPEKTSLFTVLSFVGFILFKIV